MDDQHQDYILEVKNLSKLYGPNREAASRMMRAGSDKDEVYQKTGATVALWDVNLRVKRGEIFVIIGLSGSGKSTVVRCINRLNRPSSGSVLYEGRNIMKMDRKELLDLRRTKMSMVFQSFGLLSHRDVLSNVAYGLELRGLSKAERDQKAKKTLDMVGLSGWEHQSCDSLSGGMRQRVGIARALTNDPDVLLMDEPFSALDPLVRKDMQFELLKIQRRLNKTVVFITHDIDEAFKLGDTVAIMQGGRVVQVGSPEELSASPNGDYVRRFIEGADLSRVTSVKNVMITPTALARLNDQPRRAIRTMNKNAFSTVYVVDDRLMLRGILTIGDAVRAHREGLKIKDVMITEYHTVSPEVTVHDVMPISAQAAYPVAVIDDTGQLQGIVTKASVLSSMINEEDMEPESA